MGDIKVWQSYERIVSITLLGEIDALVCSDGSCEGAARVGLVYVHCTHPEHHRKRVMEQWEKYQERVNPLPDKEYDGLAKIVEAGPITYASMHRQAKVTVDTITNIVKKYGVTFDE